MPLFGLTALAPAQVWIQGSDALTTRSPSWSGNVVATTACDKPAASGVPPPASVAPPAAEVAPPCDYVG
jgi:hypothetical protein